MGKKCSFDQLTTSCAAVCAPVPRPRIEIIPRDLHKRRVRVPSLSLVLSVSYEQRVTVALICTSLVAQEDQGVFVSTVCDFVHDYMYNLSRKLLAILGSGLCVFGSFQEQSCSVSRENDRK